MKSYGVNSKTIVNSAEDAMIEEFTILGYTIIPDVLSSHELGIYRSELDRIYSEQEKALGKDFLKIINEEYLARALAAYSNLFAELACHNKMQALARRVLGDYYILHLQNGIINMPSEEHHQSSWHRDLPYQNWTSSESMGCNIFYCMDDFTAETGGTFLLPYSHKLPHMPSEQYVAKHGIQIQAKAGSVVFFDSMLFHKAGFNKSKSIRRGVNTMYVRPIIRQQIDFTALMKNNEPTDPFKRMLFGFDNITPDSVETFRNARYEKKLKSY
jgi:ectoine hydroxylase-related dioxygenase (phytanoyl-CoA dioxygenase family)